MNRQWSPRVPTLRVRARRAPSVVVTSVLSLLLPGHGGSAAQAASPMGGGGTVTLEPVPARPAEATSRRLVFSCRTPNLVIFSDRPCGPLAIPRELLLQPSQRPSVPTPRAGSNAGVDAEGKAPVMRRSNAKVQSPDDFGNDGRADPTEAREDLCTRLEHAVDALDQRMRAGYTAREAARLWGQWREARERVRESGC